MKLIESKDWNRRDFNGIYECESCKNIEEHKGCYDDDYFHQNVSPSWECEKCGQSTKSLNLKPEEIITKYPKHLIV